MADSRWLNTPLAGAAPLQAVNVLRKQLRIKVTGAGLPPPPLRYFTEVREKYSCGSRLFANLEALSFPGPTPIQAQAIPALLKGRELLAVAPTGGSQLNLNPQARARATL